jgi:hypothetical protein
VRDEARTASCSFPRKKRIHTPTQNRVSGVVIEKQLLDSKSRKGPKLSNNCFPL